MEALLFDFNGTISDDEGVQCGIYRELFAEHGRPLSEEEYFTELAGFSDPEIVDRWLGPGHPAAGEVLAGRIRLFRERVGDGSTVPPHVREALRSAAGRVHLAVVSGAGRAEVETVVRVAGIDVFELIVSAESVERGKPDPEGYLRALDLLGVAAGEAVAIEDSPPGVAAAKAAGLRCVALLGTVSAERLQEADEITPRLDATLVDRLLSP